MSVIFGFGYGVLLRIADIPYEPAVNSEVVREFLGDYGLQVVLAFVSVMIAAIYAALSALLMQIYFGRYYGRRGHFHC